MGLAATSTNYLSWNFFFFPQSFCNLLSEDFTAHWDTVGWSKWVPCLWNPLLGSSELCSTLTSLQLSLPLTLGPPSMCTRHMIQFLSLSLWSTQWVLHPNTSLLSDPLGLQGSQDCVQRLSLSFPSMSYLHCSLKYAHLRISQYAMSQICLCIDQGLLGWSITVHFIVTSRGETWRAYQIAILLTSPKGKSWKQ